MKSSDSIFTDTRATGTSFCVLWRSTTAGAPMTSSTRDDKSHHITNSFPFLNFFYLFIYFFTKKEKLSNGTFLCFLSFGRHQEDKKLLTVLSADRCDGMTLSYYHKSLAQYHELFISSHFFLLGIEASRSHFTETAMFYSCDLCTRNVGF